MGLGLVVFCEMIYIFEFVGVVGKISCLVLEEVVVEVYMVFYLCVGLGMVIDYFFGLCYLCC